MRVMRVLFPFSSYYTQHSLHLDPGIHPTCQSCLSLGCLGSWMLRLDWSLSRLVTQDIKTQPQINRHITRTHQLSPQDSL